MHSTLFALSALHISLALVLVSQTFEAAPKLVGLLLLTLGLVLGMRGLKRFALPKPKLSKLGDSIWHDEAPGRQRQEDLSPTASSPAGNAEANPPVPTDLAPEEAGPGGNPSQPDPASPQALIPGDHSPVQSSPTASDVTESPPMPLPQREAAPQEDELPSADQRYVDRVVQVIESHLDDPELTVERLATELVCDRSHLFRKLRALTGHSPSSLIRTLRLRRAKHMLRNNIGMVSEIAYSVGFKSAAHFSNCFAKEFGERPSAYAGRHRQVGVESQPSPSPSTDQA